MQAFTKVFAAAALVALVSFTPVTLAEPAILEQARHQLEAGRAESAYALLSPLEAELAGEPGYDYLLGIAALDSGRPTEAIFALERVLTVQPGHLLARAEIARAYFLLGEFATSRREFETVQGQDIPAHARATIEKYLSVFDRRPAGETTRWGGYLAAAGGHDTNVNAATSSRGVAIPAFGGVIAQLDAAGVESSVQFARLAGGISVVHPLRRDLALSAGIDAYQNFLDDDTEFEQGSLSGYVGLDWSRGQMVYSGAVQADHFRVDDRGFRNFVGVLGQARRLLSNVSQVTGYVQAGR